MNARLWTICILVWCGVFTLLYLTGCASDPVYQRGPLSRQILRVRLAYGLSNSRCLERQGSLQICTKWDMISYDLSDAGLRSELRQTGFICKYGDSKVAHARYQICLDKPGYCHRERHCDWWVFGCKMEEDYIPQTELQRLVNADMRCFAEDVFDYPDM